MLVKEGKRGVRPEDIFRIAMVGDVAISPDGGTICFVQTRMDRESNAYLSDLWTVAAGAAVGEAIQFTHGPRTVAQPRWSPDGRWLAFLADRKFAAGNAGTVMEAGEGGGEAGEESDGRVADDVVTVTRIRYKGDGAGFTNARRSHLWLTDLDGQEVRLTEGSHSNTAPAWSPDGASLVFMSKRGPADEADRTDGTDLWVIAADSSMTEPRKLPTGDGPADAPAWSPDGRWIAFVGDTHANTTGGNDTLWVVAADGAGEPRNLTGALDLSMGLGVSADVRAGLSAARPVWSPDSAAIYTQASAGGDTPLWRVPLEGGEPTRAVEARGQQVQSFAFCAAGTTLALNLGESLNPGDVYCARAEGTTRRLTAINGAFFDEVALAEPEAFEYAGAQGWSIEGWLVRPVGYEEGRQYPLILAIHGGPHAAYGNLFFFDFQLLAAHGWGVLFTNPRGSTNYGEHFTLASNDDWGGDDYRDLMLGVDAAIERSPWVDRDRLGVTGGSYGGYMVNWIVTQTGRFKAAVTERSICNMISKWGTSDIGYIGNDLQWGGPPWENMAFYLERSPLTHVQRVTTPLLLIHSERDFRCLIEQGEQFFTALKYLGRTAEFVRFPDEGHELSRSGQPLHRLERLRRLEGWFAKYL